MIFEPAPGSWYGCEAAIVQRRKLRLAKSVTSGCWLTSEGSWIHTQVQLRTMGLRDVFYLSHVLPEPGVGHLPLCASISCSIEWGGDGPWWVTERVRLCLCTHSVRSQAETSPRPPPFAEPSCQTPEPPRTPDWKSGWWPALLAVSSLG